MILIAAVIVVVDHREEIRIFKDAEVLGLTALMVPADQTTDLEVVTDRDQPDIQIASGGKMTPRPHDPDFAPFESDFKWLENVRRDLFQKGRSRRVFTGALWPLVVDLRNLRIAAFRVKRNKGGRTAGVDGVRFSHLEKCLDGFIHDLHEELRMGYFEPNSVSRKWIPKENKKEMRGLGIPTISDRIVQAAILQIIEPFFEARFLPSSVGFRKGRGVPDGVRQIKAILNEPGFSWVIEGDIEKCFDRIDHAKLLSKLKRIIRDPEVLEMIVGFMIANIDDRGVRSESVRGVPQGALLSPLLSNVALSFIEETYSGKRKSTNAVRYSDDFVIFCRGTEKKAHLVKQDLADRLKSEAGLTLSIEKTKITNIHESFRFIGYEFKRVDSSAQVLVSEPKIQKMANRISGAVGEYSLNRDFEGLLEKLGPLLRGWAGYHIVCDNTVEVFQRLDRLVFRELVKWICKKRSCSPRAAFMWLNFNGIETVSEQGAFWLSDALRGSSPIQNRHLLRGCREQLA